MKGRDIAAQTAITGVHYIEMDYESLGRSDCRDLLGSYIRLGSLQDNGGPTKTHALLEGSPAIDSGNDQFAPETDQRGIIRPRGRSSDIGAFER